MFSLLAMEKKKRGKGKKEKKKMTKKILFSFLSKGKYHGEGGGGQIMIYSY